MQNGPDTEPARRIVAAVLQWGGWATCVGVFVYATVDFDPNHGDFAPQWVGFAFILSMGVGIAASIVRSRMRLTKAVITAFTAGLAAQKEATDQRVERIVRRLDGRKNEDE